LSPLISRRSIQEHPNAPHDHPSENSEQDSHNKFEQQPDPQFTQLLRNYFFMLQYYGKSIMEMLPNLSKSDLLEILSHQISLCTDVMFRLYSLDDDSFALITENLSASYSLAVSKKIERDQDKENQHARNGQKNQEQPLLHSSLKSMTKSEYNLANDDNQEGRNQFLWENSRGFSLNPLNLDDLSSHFYNWSRKNSDVRSIRQEFFPNEEAPANQEISLPHQNLTSQRQQPS